MLWVPVPITLGVYVDVHVAGLLALSVHAVNVPVPLLAGVIVPPDPLLVPLSVSVTVTVQVVVFFFVKDTAATETSALSLRGPLPSAKAEALFLLWAGSVAVWVATRVWLPVPIPVGL